MLVKWTKSIPGGERRGFVEGREFDWPMQIISKLRADYGHDCLVMVGTLADRNARQKSRNERKEGMKLSRQERLGVRQERTDVVSYPEFVETQESPREAPRRRPGRPRKVRVVQELEEMPADENEPVTTDELMATA